MAGMEVEKEKSSLLKKVGRNEFTKSDEKVKNVDTITWRT
jgi:hypothetical protein